MTIEELLEKMKWVGEYYARDKEARHAELDQLLLNYIGSVEVENLYHSFEKWYA